MRRKEQDAGLKQGKKCLCGNRAVTYRNTCWTCQPCIDKDKAIHGTDRIRSTCGFALRMSRAEISATYGDR